VERDLHNLAKLVLRERLKAGLSQEAFGARVGVSDRTIYNFERAEKIGKASYAKLDVAMGWDAGSSYTGRPTIHGVPVSTVDPLPGAPIEVADILTYLDQIALDPDDREFIRRKILKAAEADGPGENPGAVEAG
jgi:transcriptional regulator with XRE-family HTH domain